MSKEQTPITAEAEKWLKNRGSQYAKDSAVCYHMEQYAKAKLLEALEREIPIAHDKGFDREYIGMNLNREVFPKGVQYYETAVKPKYEK